MTDPSYRETPEAPERHSAEELAMGGTLMWEPIVQPLTSLEFRCLTQRMVDRLKEQGWSLVPAESAAVRPLPDWMPTPEELLAAEHYFEPHPSHGLTWQERLLRAVRWLLEERENR